MEVAKDRFELPVAVADTVNRPKTKRYYVRKYVKVEIDDEQEGGERRDE